MIWIWIMSTPFDREVVALATSRKPILIPTIRGSCLTTATGHFQHAAVYMQVISHMRTHIILLILYLCPLPLGPLLRPLLIFLSFHLQLEICLIAHPPWPMLAAWTLLRKTNLLAAVLLLLLHLHARTKESRPHATLIGWPKACPP